MTHKLRVPRTLYAKIWDDHVIRQIPGGETLLAIDRHLINEVTSPQAFEGLRRRGLSVFRPSSSLAVADHNVPTDGRDAGVAGIGDDDSRIQVETLERNVLAFGIPYVPLRSKTQGIVHVIGPELGLTLPGTTVVCGDSHTSTHGAFGTLAFGIGTSEVEHVLATQSLVQRRAKTMLVNVTGRLSKGTSAKDLVLAIIGEVGTAGATGHVIEYAGSGMTALDMAGRMTVCNMSIEAGARAGLMAPDERTFEYLRERRYAPRDRAFDAACEEWRLLATDKGAEFDARVEIDASAVVPMVTWGTTPEAVMPLDGRIPDPAGIDDVSRRAQVESMLAYMGLEPGRPLSGTPIDVAFIGSCTNGRLEDLRDAAAAVRGRRVAPHVRALVVPGSGVVKADAEREGLDRVFIDAGFEWRDAGCSMCLGMNEDRLMPGERCASSSNRNFEGRQGPGGRTHLMSPALVAIAAVTGAIPAVECLAK